VAGFDRLLRPIADWSMLTTLCTFSMPSTPSCSPGSVRVSTSRFHRALYRISLISVLLPEPEAPVTATSAPSGNFTVTLLRLFSRAPRTVSALPLPFRRRAGSSIPRRPEKYCPVGDALHFSTSLRVPCTTTSPPCTPGPGPISTIWSAARMVSSSCFTTMTVLPMSRRLSRVAIIFTLSLGCRPVLGSSST